MFSTTTLVDISQLIVSFVIIWIAAGVLIRSVEKLSKLLRFSQFMLSLFLLGTATSFPEIAVLINSLILKQPEVSMGNLVGGQIFLLFLIIPLLAIVTRGMKLLKEMQGRLLILILAVIAAPLLTLIDGRVQVGEGVLTLSLYLIFVVIFSRKMTVLERIKKKFVPPKNMNVWAELARVATCVIVLFAATQLAIRGVTGLSVHLQLHPFLVSMVIMSLGTNLPEFSLVMRAAMRNKRDIALGNYIGSATMNTLLWAILSIVARGNITLSSSVTPMIMLIAVGLIVFWWFCRTQKQLNVKEGIILISVYVAFLVMTYWLELGF